MSTPPSIQTALLTAAGLYIVIWLFKRLNVAKNIRGPASPGFLGGNLLKLMDPESGWQYQLDVSHDYDGIARITTPLGGRALLVSDPKALHSILVRDQDNFEEWSAFAATNMLLFGPGLVAIFGDQHKKQRKMLTPAFSAKYLRNMTPFFVSIARELERHLSKVATSKTQEIDVTSWLNRTALELIGRGGMGHSFGKLNAPSEISEGVKNLAAIVSSLYAGAPLTPLFKYLGPPSFRRLLVKMIPSSPVQQLRGIVDVMESDAQQILVDQEKALKGGGETEGKDIMGILLKANQSSSAVDHMTRDELLGQMITLIFTATDTTSGALARLLHLLAINPDVQEKLRKEVTEAFQHDDSAIEFQALSNLPYMDAVIRETLRVYPPIPTVFRTTLKDTSIPLLHPIVGVNGKSMTELPIAKGTDILINILGANHHRKTWGADADEWKPDRWLSELPESVTSVKGYSGVYSHLMTFIAGKRSCIGFNFSQLEMKVVLAVLIQTLEFLPPENKEISWNVGLLMTPVVKGSKDQIHSQLPLRIRRREL